MRFISAFAALLVCATPAMAERTPPLLVGTGAVTGIYFPAAGAVQRLVNDANATTPLAVQSTPGSIHNLKALADGTLDLAITQSDWAYYASKGQQEQFPAAHENLRALFGLHNEVLTIIARKDAKISSINDLKGKKINIGPVASGTRSLMDSLFKSLAWGVTDMGALSDLEPAAQSAALCASQVDAIVFIVPHPNAAVQEALNRCPANLVAVNGSAVDSLLAGNPFYGKVEIPGSTYTGATAAVPTFGIRALLLATTRLPDDAAYAIVKTVFGNIDKMNAIHPALAKLTREQMASDKLAVALHPGAEKYFREASLIAASPPNPAAPKN